MSHSFLVTALRSATAVVITSALLGCGGDNSAAPRNEAAPTFDNIWPAAAGNHWSYRLDTYYVAVPETLYATSVEVPEVPSMEFLYAALSAPIAGPPEAAGRGEYHLRFIEDISPNADMIVMRATKETQIVTGAPDSPLPLSVISLWMRTATQIGGTWPGSANWVHLDESLAPGHEFTKEMQLGEGDGRLTSRVWRTRSYSALGKTYSNCIECFYVLDYGVYPVGTAYETVGYCRPFAFGVIIFAPELGPVYCHERIFYGTDTWNDRKAFLSDYVQGAAPATERGR